MSGPSSAPRGEKSSSPGVAWESVFVHRPGERFDEDPAAFAEGELPVPPPANRAARRAAKRARKGSERPQSAPQPANATQDARDAARPPEGRTGDFEEEDA